MPADAAEIVRLAERLSAVQQNAIMGAVAADCHEWWLTENPGLPLTIAGSDWVLTSTGEAVRDHIERARAAQHDHEVG